MPGADLILLGVVAVSALIGLLRGLIREALSLIIWVGAVWCAIRYGPEFAPLLSRYLDEPVMRLWAARGLLFVGILFGGSVVAWAIGYLVRHSVITGMDRVLGLIFGLARGVVIVALVVMVLEAGGFATEPWWRMSKLIPYAAAVGDRLRDVAGLGNSVGHGVQS